MCGVEVLVLKEGEPGRGDVAVLCGLREWELFAAVGAECADEALAEDGAEAGGYEVGFYAHIREAEDG